MRKLLWVAAMLAAPAAFAGNVGFSISFNQPGLYGQINLGNVPAPQLIYSQPVLVAPPPYAAPALPPMYLHVPPGYERDWREHCAEFHACDRPVYFVRDRWYRDVYLPARRDYDEREHRAWREREDRRGWNRRDRGEHRGWDRRDGHRRGDDHGDDHGDRHGDGGR
ncbi:MAG: hypothetical protein KGL36_13260 [Gammaproteobacteria bacterium]|nr:hypothetical protein [Gammaproteobacteria bacterium]